MSGLISVIVPVHNGEAFLSDCLESLVRQTWRQLEILVIDDGSTDGSAALCRRWQEKDGRIRFFQKENGGVSSARNLGLEMARGEYAAFVDADDWLLPGMLQEQLELLVQEDGDMILGGYLAVGERERKAFRGGEGFSGAETGARAGKQSGPPSENQSGPPSENQSGPASGKQSGPFSGRRTCRSMDAGQYVEEYLLQSCSRCWSILFRREAIGETRFPEGLSIGEDLLFLSRLMPKMKRILVTEACGYCYFINAEGAMLAGFRPSYMDQITCWEMAERELAPFGKEAAERVSLCLFQAVLLTAGKLALLPPAAVKGEQAAYVERCIRAARQAWEKLGRKGRKRLSAGYRLKGLVFLHAPAMYLKLYHIWKRRSKS